MKKRADESYDDLEFFTDKGAWRGNPRVTISVHDNISFNSAFGYRAKLKEKTHAMLAYSPKRKEIVFDFTDDAKALGAFRLVQKGNNSSSISCRSFFRAHDFDKEEIAGRYIPHKERIPKIGECWVIRLNEKVEK